MINEASQIITIARIDFRTGRHDFQVISQASRPFLAQPGQINT